MTDTVEATAKRFFEARDAYLAAVEAALPGHIRRFFPDALEVVCFGFENDGCPVLRIRTVHLADGTRVGYEVDDFDTGARIDARPELDEAFDAMGDEETEFGLDVLTEYSAGENMGIVTFEFNTTT